VPFGAKDAIWGQPRAAETLQTLQPWTAVMEPPAPRSARSVLFGRYAEMDGFDLATIIRAAPMGWRGYSSACRGVSASGARPGLRGGNRPRLNPKIRR
jgi:hypothetical protein